MDSWKIVQPVLKLPGSAWASLSRSSSSRSDSSSSETAGEESGESLQRNSLLLEKMKEHERREKS